MKIEKILLASHGTIGARAAEKTSLEIAKINNSSIDHLIVIPDFWKGMMGDDWLNNAITQYRFGNYVENQLLNDVFNEISRFKKNVKLYNIEYSYHIKLGKPTHCLINAIQKNKYNLVIIGSPRPKGIAGYNSHINLNILTKELTTKLMIIPFPKK